MLAKQKTVTDIELIKLLADPRRRRILNLCESEPKTVKEIADALGEQPSRLYYHVNKLLEHNLLEVVKTRQIGNLTEKMYQATHAETYYNPDLRLMAEHPELFLSFLHKTLDPGLRMYEQRLKYTKEQIEAGNDFAKTPFHLSTIVTSHYQTAGEWKQSISNVANLLSKARNDEHPSDEEIVNMDEDPDEKGTYQYILISYRHEDAERLGLIRDLEEHSQDKEKTDSKKHASESTDNQ